MFHGGSRLKENGVTSSFILNRYPQVITDDFNDDSGRWLDGDLDSAAMIISGGRGVWSPTYSAQLILNESFETGNPPVSWTAANNATLSQVADPSPFGGSFSIDVARGGASSVPYAGQNQNLTKGITYRFVFYRRNVDAVNGVGVGIYDTVLPGYIIPVVYDASVVWNSNLKHFTAKSTGVHALQFIANCTVLAQHGRFDTVSLYSIVSKTLYRVQRIWYPSYIEAKVWRTAFSQSGVVLYKDGSNWIRLVLDGANTIRLEKMVGGTYVYDIATAPIVYAAGAPVRLTPNEDFNLFSAKYNGADVITDAAITDFDFTGNWYGGLFQAYNSGNIATASFDDYASVPVF